MLAWSTALLGAPQLFLVQLDDDLRMHAASHIGTSGLIEIEVYFPDTYPQTPPLVRLVRPVLEPHSGGTDMGALMLPVLFPEGWSTNFTMLQILRWVRVHLVSFQPQLRWSCAGHYPKSAFDQARQRIENRESMLKISSMMTEKAYIAMSRSNATSLGLMNHFPQQFEVADKVELPGHILDLLTEDGTTGSQALTFEIKAPPGVKVYCGANFSSPEPNLVIMPDWLWSCLASPECIEVKLTPVELPRALSINLNALSHKFASLSIDHNMVLQSALQNYTTLQAGMTIPVRVFEDVYHFQIASTTPVAPAVCPWLGSYWTDLGIKFGKPLVEDSDVAAPSAASGGSGTNIGIPPAPRLTHQLSASSVTSPGVSAPPGPMPLGPRMPSYTSQQSSDGFSSSGGGGAAVGRLSAAEVAKQADRERAAFEQWRRQQDSTEDAVALSAAAGQQVEGYNSSMPGGKIKVDLFNPLNNPSIPPQVTIMLNHTTTLAQLYEHIAEHFAPRHVPFDLLLRRPLPALSSALSAAGVSASSNVHVPNTSAVTVKDAQLLGKVLQAELQRKTECDKLHELLRQAQEEQADGTGQAGHITEHSAAQRAMAALERGESFGEVSTYVINGGTIGLSERFDCQWLKELQRSDVPGLQLGAEDLTLLKKDVILANLDAELI